MKLERAQQKPRNMKTSTVATCLLLSGSSLIFGCSDSGSPAGSTDPVSVGGSGGAAAGVSGGAGAPGSPNGGAGGALSSGAGSAGAGVGTAGSGGASGGSAGTAAVAGAAGAAGGNATHPSGRSAGCMKPVADSPTAWTSHNIQVSVAPAYAADYSTRVYFTRPPKNYDANKAYPVLVWGQGCGQSKAEDTVMSGGPAADNAIQVEMLANPKNHNCYSSGPDGDHADSPELPYFDAVLAEAEANFCIDTGKVYLGGWSSGGWFSSLVSCARSNLIKGVAWASAGLQVNHPDCVGPVPAVIERGVDDGGTELARAEAARESIRVRNGCSNDTEAWDPGEIAFETSTCVSYKGCMPGYPLVWCPIPGGHNNGGKLATYGYWKFWTALP
jgi:hypothetical protein